jgi:hypothetical protein
VIVVLELAGQPGEETVILARPASPAAGGPGTPSGPPRVGSFFFASPDPGPGGAAPGDLVLRTPIRAVRSATPGDGSGPSVELLVKPTPRPADQDQAPARPEGGK